MSTNNAAQLYATWNETMDGMKRQAPEIGRAFGAMYPNLMRAGALSVKDKELIALAIGMALRCEPCVYAHAEKAFKDGATREEFIETAGVVVAMTGGPGYTHVPELLNALDELGVG